MDAQPIASSPLHAWRRSVLAGSARKRIAPRQCDLASFYLRAAGQLKAGQDFVITLSSEIIERCAVDRCERTTSMNERILA
jgi:hypothetical protein